MQRTRGQTILAVVLALLALNAWMQVGLVVLGRSDAPPLLASLQALIGAAGTAAAWGSWRAARWAPAAAIGWGAVTAGMLLGLAPILDLEPEARGGLWSGAAVVSVFSIWSAWYLRRLLRVRESAATRSVA